MTETDAAWNDHDAAAYAAVFAEAADFTDVFRLPAQIGRLLS